MNEKTFALLEFDRLREEIGAYCLSPEGRAEFLRRVPSADEAQVEAWKGSARAWNFTLDGESPPPFRSWPEVLPVFAPEKTRCSSIEIRFMIAIVKS